MLFKFVFFVLQACKRRAGRRYARNRKTAALQRRIVQMDFDFGEDYDNYDDLFRDLQDEILAAVRLQLLEQG